MIILRKINGPSGRTATFTLVGIPPSTNHMSARMRMEAVNETIVDGDPHALKLAKK